MRPPATATELRAARSPVGRPSQTAGEALWAELGRGPRAGPPSPRPRRLRLGARSGGLGAILPVIEITGNMKPNEINDLAKIWDRGA